MAGAAFAIEAIFPLNNPEYPDEWTTCLILLRSDFPVNNLLVYYKVLILSKGATNVREIVPAAAPQANTFKLRMQNSTFEKEMFSIGWFSCLGFILLILI